MADTSYAPPEGAPPITRVKRYARTAAAWFWANVTVGAFGVWVIGEVFRDRYSITGLFFLVPTAAPAAALLVAALLAFACGCRRIALAAALLWMFPTFWLLFIENQWIPPRPRGDTARSLRLVQWNVGPISGRPEVMAAVLKPLAADAYVLSECYSPEASDKVTKALGSDYTLFHMRQIAVIARGAVKLTRTDEQMPNRLYVFEWESRYGRVAIMAVDLPARPIYSRAPWLREVHERILFIKPDLVVGDFNARRRSHWLGRLPKGYAHAYDEAGTGWCYSWPDGFPFWDIDQCIFGPRIRPIRHAFMTTGASDHRLQWFDFSISDRELQPTSK